MLYKIRKIWSPEIFQGHGKTYPYFEGWYYKLVDNSGRNVYAIIPGVVISKKDSHCFIQILDGQTGSAAYHRLPADQFWASRNKLELRIGSNIFKNDSLELNIDSQGEKIEGQIQMSNPVSWPVKLLSPGIMGWYAFVPFMECYHGVISLDHRLSGSLNIDKKTIDFYNGRGYIEKDWGKSFPKAYIWIQCNHFDRPGISLTASVADIPWLNSSFRGFIIGFLFEGKLHRFTTYTKATIQNVRITDTKVSFVVFAKRYSLKVEAERSGGGILHAPLLTHEPDEMEMQQRVQQGLSGKISIEFGEKNKDGEKLIYSGTGSHAGIEISGDIACISDNPK